MAKSKNNKPDGAMTWTSELKTLLRDDVRERIEREQAARGTDLNTTREIGNRTVITLVGPRAAGKTTVGRALVDRLPGWRFVDLDEVYDQRHRKGAASELMPDTENYYDDLRNLLVEHVQDGKNLVLAVSGGSLVNSKYPFGCLDSLQACQQFSQVVLLLPSRFDFRNLSILYQRESQREYGRALADKTRLKEICRRNYKERVPFYKGHADLVVYGVDPQQSAGRIAAAFNLG